MEKFKKPFLEFDDKLLKHNPNTIYNCNDRDIVFNELKFYKSRRVILLGRSNVHLLGHCINIGIDTFPTPQVFL